MKNVCSVEGCSEFVHSLGMCGLHSSRMQRHGDPLRGRLTLAERFWAYVEVGGADECWNWKLPLYRGYGRIRLSGQRERVQAHRLSYEMANGPVPEGLVVDHICHNGACVNPNHLRVCTPKQNGENRRGPDSRSTSGVRGVTWNKKCQKWRASVRHFDQLHYLGQFESLAEAEAAAIAKRNELFTHNTLDRIAS